MKEKSQKLKYNNGVRVKDRILHYLNALLRNLLMLKLHFKLLLNKLLRKKKMKNCHFILLEKIMIFLINRFFPTTVDLKKTNYNA